MSKASMNQASVALLRTRDPAAELVRLLDHLAGRVEMAGDVQGDRLVRAVRRPHQRLPPRPIRLGLEQVAQQPARRELRREIACGGEVVVGRRHVDAESAARVEVVAQRGERARLLLVRLEQAGDRVEPLRRRQHLTVEVLRDGAVREACLCGDHPV
jgi:hypothetical protein